MITSLKRLWRYLNPPPSPECQRLLSLLEEDGWQLVGPWPHGIARGNVELFPEHGIMSEFKTTEVVIHHVNVTRAFGDFELYELWRRAFRIRKRLIKERDRRVDQETVEAARERLRNVSPFFDDK